MRLIRPTAITESGAFSRASTKTYVDKNGVVQTAAINEPCYDYSGGVFRGLLLEPEATNLCLQSQNFTTAPWAGGGTSIEVSFNHADPAGGTTAACIYTGAGNANAGLYQPGFALGDRVVSVWLRGEVGGELALVGFGNAGTAEAIIITSTSWRRYSVVTTAADEYLVIYAENDTPQKFYCCFVQVETGLQATSYIPTLAAPVTRAADVNIATLLSTVPENDYPAWSAVTAYVVDDYCIKGHKVWRCGDNNTNFDPEVAANQTGTPPKWIYISATNRHKMFDQVSGSQTVQAEEICIAIRPGIIDSLGFVATLGTKIEAVMYDPVEGIVYTETIDLIYKSTVNDAYSYMVEPIITADAGALLGIPPYSNATLSLRISNPGGNAKCGTFVVGLQFDFGGTEWNPVKGIVSYSVKGANDFGEYELIKRNNAKKMSATVIVENDRFDAVDQIMAQYESVIVFWVGTDAAYSAFIMLGFYNEYSMPLGVEQSVLSVEIEGVV